MKVSECSRKSNTSIDTIRYYEKINLLKVNKAAHSQKEYTDADVERLIEIDMLKKTDLSLDDIRDFLDAKEVIASMQEGQIDFAAAMSSLSTLKKLNEKLDNQRKNLDAAADELKESMNLLKISLLK